VTEKCWCGGRREGDVCLDSEHHNPETKVNTAHPKRLYVSGPMSGYPDSNYPAFYLAADMLQGYGYETVNPADVGAEGGQYTDLLKKDILLLLDCEGVAVLEGWWASRGAQAEVGIAGIIGLPVRPVAEWIRLAASGDVKPYRMD
jgi:hypothetical protein